MEDGSKNDFFISYADKDIKIAEQIYKILIAVGYSVFFAKIEIHPGADWKKELKKGLDNSFLVVLILSKHSEEAYWQKTEISHTIELYRHHKCFVLPIFLDNITSFDFEEEFNLNVFQRVEWMRTKSILQLASQIENCFNINKTNLYLPNKIVLKTVIIITGCSELPEIYDRNFAYGLKEYIDKRRKEKNINYLTSLVMGDWYFDNWSYHKGHPNVISIGSRKVNKISRSIENNPEVEKIEYGTDKKWQILRLRNRWCIFGEKAEDTIEAVEFFKKQFIDNFLDRLWAE